jgi:hypothetical protein
MSSSSSEDDFFEENEKAKQVSQAKSSKRSREYRSNKRYCKSRSKKTSPVFSIEKCILNASNDPGFSKLDQHISPKQVNLTKTFMIHLSILN